MARIDDDTWDLAASVGATATMVAAGRARGTRTTLLDDPFAEPLVRAVGIDLFTRWASGSLDPAEVDDPGVAFGMQRMTDRMVMRTRHIDTFCSEAAAAGIRQAVILASGLDTRSYRLSWPPGMALFEIDQPLVLEFKTATLATLGAAPTAELTAVPVDLRHDWPSALRESGFDAAQPTAWIAEGLLAYLPSQAQDRLLDNLTALSAHGSRLMAEIFWNSVETVQVVEAAIQKWYRAGLDTKLDSLVYRAKAHDAATYLNERGWRTQRAMTSQLLADNGLPVPAPTDDELAFADNYFCTAVLSLPGERAQTR
jgi:methyltransferase (TIGR00027 family)